MSRHLGALPALSEDLGLIPSNHMAALNPSPKGSDNLFWSPKTPHIHMKYMQTQYSNI